MGWVLGLPISPPNLPPPTPHPNTSIPPPPLPGGVNDNGQTGQGVAPSTGRKLLEFGNKESPLIAFSQPKGIRC